MKKMKEKKNLNIFVIITLLILLIISLFLNIYFVMDEQETNNYNDENIIFFGDSITEQYDLSKYYPKNNVINSGISGNKTEDLIDRIKNDVYKYNPSKVFILIGANDLNNDIYNDDILFNIQTIINGIKTNRKSAKIYVESIYPINTKIKDFPNTSNEEIKKMNKKIEIICDESNVTYIDVYSMLVDKSGDLKELYTKDGLHLSNLGYLKVTSILDKYVNEKN